MITVTFTVSQVTIMVGLLSGLGYDSPPSYPPPGDNPQATGFINLIHVCIMTPLQFTVTYAYMNTDIKTTITCIDAFHNCTVSH